MTWRLDIGVNGARYVVDVSAAADDPLVTLSVFTGGPMLFAEHLVSGDAERLADALRDAASRARAERTEPRRAGRPGTGVQGETR